MAVYKHRTVRHPVTCKRHCEYCAHKFETTRYFECHSSDVGGGYIPSADQFDRLSKKFCTDTYNRATYGVLCPKCLKFSSAAIEKHLADNDLLDGAQSLATRLFVPVFACQVSLVAFIAFVAVVMHLTGRNNWLVAIIGIALITFWVVFRFIKLLLIRRTLQRLTDGQIHQFLVSEYLRSGVDSMHGLFHSGAGDPKFPELVRKMQPRVIGSPIQGDHPFWRRLSIMRRQLAEYCAPLEEAGQLDLDSETDENAEQRKPPLNKTRKTRTRPREA